MATNYFGLQQGPEYNQNGDSYNGFMGSQSGPSIMNSGSQPSTTKSGSSSPFDSFLTHATAMSDYLNGGTSTRPWIGSSTQPVAPPNPYAGPSRPGVSGSILPVPATSGAGSLTGVSQGPGGTYYDQSHFQTATGQPDALAFYRQWRPNMSLDQLGQYWGGAGQGQDLGTWWDANFNPDGTPKAGGGQQGFVPITGGSDTLGPTAGGTSPYQEPVNNGTYRPDFFGLRAPGSQTGGAPTGNPGLTNLSGQPTPVPVGTPGATGTPGSPGAPGTVADMIHQLLSPLQQQQQQDLIKSLNANAAVTGDINAGGYSQGNGPSSVNRNLSNLMAQQGSQEAGYLQQANESALERQLRLALGNMGLEGTKYSADAGLQGAMAGANATEGAASIAANSALQRAGMDYNLGLGNLDVSRENNLMNFMSSLYGMSPQMLQTLLASSPEGLLSGQTVPTGNIIVKP